MSSTPVLPNYDVIAQALLKTGSEISPAEAHGLVCGIISTSPKGSVGNWEKLILGPKKNTAAKSQVQEVYTISYQLLNEFSFEFNLLLPDNDADLNERAECLGLWCQGFLVGLQQGPLSLPADASTDSLEAMDDLAEIAQVSYGNLGPSNEDETAYFELVEYVRLSVLMLYHEIQATEPAHASKDQFLH